MNHWEEKTAGGTDSSTDVVVIQDASFGNLVGISGSISGQEFSLTAGTLVLGRDPNQCNLVLNDVGISRRHAVIRASRDGYVLEDLGTRNGTLVNGEPVRIQALNSGDEIQICGVRLVIEFKAPAGRRVRRWMIRFFALCSASLAGASLAAVLIFGSETDERVVAVPAPDPLPAPVVPALDSRQPDNADSGPAGHMASDKAETPPPAEAAAASLPVEVVASPDTKARVRAILQGNGDPVEPGTVLVQFDTTKLRRDLETLKLSIESLQELARAQGGDAAKTYAEEKARLRKLTRTIRSHQVRSPIAGVVAGLSVAVGDWINPGEKICVIEPK